MKRWLLVNCILFAFVLLFGFTSCADGDIPSDTTNAPDTTGVPVVTPAPETTKVPESEPVEPAFNDYQVASNPATRLKAAQVSDRLADDMKIRRSLLSEEDKKIYDLLENKMCSFSSAKINIPSGMESKYEEIYWAVIADRPELFSSVYKISSVTVWNIMHVPDVEGKAPREYAAQTIFAADKILEDMPKDLDTIEKYVWIADYICNNVDDSSKAQDAVTKVVYGVGGALLNGYSDNRGFRQAFLFLCQRAGLWCATASYKNNIQDGVVLVKLDDEKTYYMYISESEDVSPFFRGEIYFKTERQVNLKSKIAESGLVATATVPYVYKIPVQSSQTPVIKDYQIAAKPAKELSLEQLNNRLPENTKIRRSLLDEKEKDIYDRLEKSMRLYSQVKIPIPAGMEDTYEKIYRDVLADYPELFMTVSKTSTTGFWTIKHKENIDGTESKKYMSKLILAADRILEKMPEGLSTEKKYVWIADYVCNNVDSSVGAGGTTSSTRNSAGAALLNKNAGSIGFKQAFLLLCQRAGLWCAMASYSDKPYDGTLLVKLDNGDTYYMCVYEAEEISPFFRGNVYFKTERQLRLKSKIAEAELVATAAFPFTYNFPIQTTETSVIKDHQTAKVPAQMLSIDKANDRLATDMKIRRSLLSEDEKDIYDRLEKSIRMCSEMRIPIPAGMDNTYEKIYWAIMADHPELMGCSNKIGLTNNPETVELWELQPVTKWNGMGIKTYIKKIILEADKILEKMPSELSTREKYIWIADYICENIDLFTEAPPEIDTSGCYGVGGALMKGYSSSNGFKETFVFLCQRAGLWCAMSSYKNNMQDGAVLVKFDDESTYYMCIYEAEQLPAERRADAYFKTELQKGYASKINEPELVATGTDPYNKSEDDPTFSPEFETFMTIDGLSEDAKAFFCAAKEKSGYSIVDGTLIVENGSIEIGFLDYFRAVYGEGTAEFMKYVDTVRDIGYWFVNPGTLAPDPQGKIKAVYGRYYFAQIEDKFFEENNIHDPDSLRAFLETKFTDRMVEQIMKACGDGIGEVEQLPPIVYYEGELLAYVGGQGMYGNHFDAEFFIKEKSADRVLIICRKKIQKGIITTDRVADYEIVFIREGDTWLCDQLPDIWRSPGTISTTRAAYTESTPFEKAPDTKELLANAESRDYEEYPGCNSVPYTAVLWRDGVSTYIDVNDPRLIMLVNMYHNSVYNSKYGWTQGCLDNSYYTKYVYAPVRLELTFKWDGGYSYDKHDKIVISCPEGEMSGFVVIYSGAGTYTDAPEWAMIRYPYEMYYMDWLGLVGF